MWTRILTFVACGLTASIAVSARGMSPGNAEIVGTPSPYAQVAAPAPMPAAMPTGSPCAAPCSAPCETAGSPPTTPWYYWWTTWHWFDRPTDRGQHYPYLPPLPGWYYFRPYSVSQLRAQQEAVMQWGGDPLNPYATGTLPPSDLSSDRPKVAPVSMRTSASANYEIVASHAEPIPQVATDIIPWPPILMDVRFNNDRARIEGPYRRAMSGAGTPSAAEFQDMIDAAAQMKATLWRMTSDIGNQDSLNAEKFLDQLAAEARGQLQAAAATASTNSNIW